MKRERQRTSVSLRSVSRRDLLSAVVAGSTVGSLGCIGSGEGNCRLGQEEFFNETAVRGSVVSVTSSNVDEGGTCDRTTTHWCLETTLEVDPTVVAAVESRTPNGSLVRRRPVEDSAVHDVYLQLGEVPLEERVERDVVLYGHDGEVVDRVRVHARCTDEANVTPINDTDDGAIGL